MRPPGRKSNWPGPVGANPSEEEAQDVQEFCILANSKVHFELNVTRLQTPLRVGEYIVAKSRSEYLQSESPKDSRSPFFYEMLLPFPGSPKAILSGLAGAGECILDIVQQNCQNQGKYLSSFLIAAGFIVHTCVSFKEYCAFVSFKNNLLWKYQK